MKNGQTTPLAAVVEKISISLIDPFPNHPFYVFDDNEMIQGDFFTEQLAQYEDIDFIALSDDEKKKVANELIERILLSEDGSIKIVWKI